MRCGTFGLLGVLALAAAATACGLDPGDSSSHRGQKSPPGGPPGDPDAVPRVGGNGIHGLDHQVVLIAISPDQGPTAGGTDVLLIGFNFQSPEPVNEVIFGGLPATSFDIQAQNKIFAVTPPHPAGIVDVSVRSGAGGESTLTSSYTYLSTPTQPCMSLLPDRGPQGGGSNVQILAISPCSWDPSQIPTVLFGGIAALVVYWDSVLIYCTTPASPVAGPVDVEVQSSTCNCILPGGFTYESLSGGCFAVNPGSGPLYGGNFVTITNHSPCQWPGGGLEVYFGTQPSTSVTFIDTFTIRAIVPPSQQPGPVDVTINVLGPGSPCTCVEPDAYTYQ